MTSYYEIMQQVNADDKKTLYVKMIRMMKLVMMMMIAEVTFHVSVYGFQSKSR